MTLTRWQRLRTAVRVAAFNAGCLHRTLWRWWQGGPWRQIFVGAALLCAVEVLLLWRVLQAIQQSWGVS